MSVDVSKDYQPVEVAVQKVVVTVNGALWSTDSISLIVNCCSSVSLLLECGHSFCAFFVPDT